MLHIAKRNYISEALSDEVYRDMHTEIEEMMSFGGDFGEVSERNYMFRNEKEENVDARIDTPSRLELGCPSYSASSDRFAASLGIKLDASSTPFNPVAAAEPAE